MAKFLNALQVLCMISMVPLGAGSKICVVGSTSSCTNSELCSNQTAFQSITTAALGLTEVDIYFCSADYRFNSASSSASGFTDMSSVVITGVSPRSTIYCSNSFVGFHFTNVRKIVMSNIRLIQCGIWNVLEEFNIPFVATVSIMNSSMITIANIGIQNSQGIGIALVNNHDYFQLH